MILTQIDSGFFVCCFCFWEVFYRFQQSRRVWVHSKLILIEERELFGVGQASSFARIRWSSNNKCISINHLTKNQSLLTHLQLRLRY